MAYENLKINTSIQGNIYLGSVLKSGLASSERRLITDEVLAATIDWMIINNEKKVSFASNDKSKVHSIYYTDDPDKQKAIESILKEVE